MFSGQNPYLSLLTMPGPFNYPPTVFLFISFFQDKMFFDILSAMSFFIAIFLLTKKRLLISIILFIIFNFSYFPYKFNFGMGQINNFILLFIILSYYYNPFFLSYAVGIKLVPIIYLLYYLIIKDYKNIFLVILFICSLFLLSLFVVPWEFQKVYFQDVFFRALAGGGKEVYYNQSLAGFLSRANLQILFYPFSFLFIFITWYKARKLKVDRVFASVTCLMLLLNPIAWQHHFVVAIIPLILLFKEDKLIVTLAYLFLAWNFKRPEIVGAEVNIILSHQFLGTFMLWILAIFEKNTRRILPILYALTILFIYLSAILCRGNICF